jgi:hypothetical protein
MAGEFSKKAKSPSSLFFKSVVRGAHPTPALAQASPLGHRPKT